MHKKVIITLDEAIYDGLVRVVGRRGISQFLEDLARPHVLTDDLTAAYLAMAADEEREREAEEWSDALIADATHAPR